MMRTECAGDRRKIVLLPVRFEARFSFLCSVGGDVRYGDLNTTQGALRVGIKVRGKILRMLEKGLMERLYVGALGKACRGGVTDRSCHVNPARAKPI